MLTAICIPWYSAGPQTSKRESRAQACSAVALLEIHRRKGMKVSNELEPNCVKIYSRGIPHFLFEKCRISASSSPQNPEDQERRRVNVTRRFTCIALALHRAVRCWQPPRVVLNMTQLFYARVPIFLKLSSSGYLEDLTAHSAVGRSKLLQ